jgi:autotransporter translocation and assembly factor TamB
MAAARHAAKKRTAAARLLRCAAALALLAIILAGIAFGLLQTPAGQSSLAAFLSRQWSSEALTVQIEGLSGFLPFSIGIEKLTLGDEAGPWLIIRNAETSLSLREALSGVVHVERLTAESVTLSRLPSPNASVAQARDADGNTLLSHPLPAIRVMNVDLPALIIESAVFGRKQSLSFRGAAMAEGFTLRVAGRVEAKGWIEGQLDADVEAVLAPTLSASAAGVATLRRVDTSGVEAATATFAMRLHADGTAEAETVVSGCFDGLAVDARASASWDGVRVEIPRIEATGAGLDLDGHGWFDPSAHSGALSLWAFLRDAQTIKDRTEAIVEPGAQAFAYVHTVDGESLEVAGFAELTGAAWDSATAERVRIEGATPDALAGSEFQLAVEGDGMRWLDTVRIARLRADIRRDAFDITARAAIRGWAEQPFSVALAVTGRTDEGNRAATIERGTVTYGDWRTLFTAPLRIAEAPGQPGVWRLDASSLSVNEAELSASGTLSENAIAGTLALNVPRLSRTAAPFELPLDAAVTATLNVSGHPGAPNVIFRARLAEVKPAVDAPIPPASAVVDAEGALSEGVLTINATLSGWPGLDVDGTASLPLELSLVPPALRLPDETGGRAALVGRFDIHALLALLAIDNQGIDGRVLVEAGLDDWPASLVYRGNLTLTNGLFQDVSTGVHVGDIFADFEFNRDMLVVRQGRASDGRGGTLALEGSYALPGMLAPQPAELMLQANRFLLARRDGLRVVGSGDVRLLSGIERLRVEADMRIDDARVSLDELSVPTVTILRDDGDDENGNDDRVATNGIDIAIVIRVPSTLIIRGEQLDVRWGGRLELTRTRGIWHSVGAIEALFGSFTFMGRQFRIERSSITLDGSWPPVPLFDMTATYTHADMTASLHFTGRLANPSIRLVSTPPYPENEILARVLFGQTLSTITPLQAYQIVAATGQLRGRDGMDLMRSVRSALGVDRLELREEGRDERGEAAIAAGKYFGRRLYMEVSQPLGESEAGPKVRAQYEIRRNLSLESEAGVRTLPGIMLFWRKDY